MKKSIKKLILNKITIANLDTVEMNQKFGGIAKPKTQGTKATIFSGCCQTLLLSKCVTGTNTDCTIVVQ